MQPGEFEFTTLTDESRILGSFGKDRGIVISPVGVAPPPLPVFRHPQSVIIPLDDPDTYLVLEWTTGDAADGEPEAHSVLWRAPDHGDT